jgi:hypothetical protein
MYAWYIQESNGTLLGDQTRSADFIKTCFTGETIAVVWYLVSNDVLSSSNRFRYQGYVFKVNRI